MQRYRIFAWVQKLLIIRASVAHYLPEFHKCQAKFLKGWFLRLSTSSCEKIKTISCTISFCFPESGLVSGHLIRNANTFLRSIVVFDRLRFRHFSSIYCIFSVYLKTSGYSETDDCLCSFRFSFQLYLFTHFAFVLDTNFSFCYMSMKHIF